MLKGVTLYLMDKMFIIKEKVLSLMLQDFETFGMLIKLFSLRFLYK